MVCEASNKSEDALISSSAPGVRGASYWTAFRIEKGAGCTLTTRGYPKQELASRFGIWMTDFRLDPPIQNSWRRNYCENRCSGAIYAEIMAWRRWIDVQARFGG